jgi:hypothetical protein
MNPNIRRTLESFGNGPATLSIALRQFPRKMWLYKSLAACPSIHEIVWELADREVIEYVFIRRFIADPGPWAIEIDPSASFGNLGFFYFDIKDAMGIIRALRRATYRFLESLPETAWTNAAEFPIHGRLSLGEWLEIRESYFPEHIKRMELIYSEWFEATSSSKAETDVRRKVVFESFVP